MTVGSKDKRRVNRAPVIICATAPLSGLPFLGLALVRTDMGETSLLGVSGGMAAAVVGWLALVVAVPVAAGFVSVPVVVERSVLALLAVSIGALLLLTLGFMLAGDSGALTLTGICAAGLSAVLFWMSR